MENCDRRMHLLDDIEFDKSIGAFCLRVERIDLISMHPIGVFNVHQPFVEQRQIGTLPVEGGANAAAIIMTADDDMRNLEHLHRILNDAETIEVRGDHLIGDVAMRKYRPGTRVDDYVGGNAAVGTADPQKFRFLIGREAIEVAGIALPNLFGPGLVLE